MGKIAISCFTVGVQEDKIHADAISREVLSCLNIRLTV